MADAPAASDPDVTSIVNALAEVAGTATRVGAAMSVLPELMRDWRGGAPGEPVGVPTLALPGPTAVAEAWRRLAEPGAVFVLPDWRMLAELPGPVSGVRVILGPVAAEDVAEAGAELARLDVAARTVDDPPAWFGAGAGDVSAYPSAWGRERPELVLLLGVAVATQGFRMLFEEVWRRAARVDAPVAAWQSVLSALDGGAGDEEVARALHLSERTVRRRVHEATEALGASNRFTLGLAWATRVARPGAC
ncbi:MAG: hypothetical protein J7480_08625 [Microbacteriaceae bacterium]|nr:hypothetical protein [Microbacteriaceae bacterium]